MDPPPPWTRSRRPGGTAIAKPTNLGIKSDVVDMVGFAVGTYGSLDILVNNAHSWGTRDQPTGLPVPTPLESFRRRGARLDVRHRVPRNVLGDAGRLPHIRERGGRIINFASWYGMIGNAGTVGCNITKEAIRGLMEPPPGSGLAMRSPSTPSSRRLRPTPRTTSGAPTPRRLAAAVAAIPMGRLGDPHLDIAPAVVLATDDARYITGQTLGVDGRSFLHA